MELGKVLSIAGSDCSGGAGIQADLKTMSSFGVFGMSVITALTAQNTRGVFGVLPVPIDFVKQQIDAVFADIQPQAVKIGMLGNIALIEAVGDSLHAHQAQNVVIDPVMVATSGGVLSDSGVENALLGFARRCGKVITPNVSEAEALSKMSIRSHDDMIKVATQLHQQAGCAVLLKGGHFGDDANDLLVWEGGIRWFEGRRIDTSNTHGTGCTLSSAIACRLARGDSLVEAIAVAKRYVFELLSRSPQIGGGNGALDHTLKRF